MLRDSASSGGKAEDLVEGYLVVWCPFGGYEGNRVQSTGRRALALDQRGSISNQNGIENRKPEAEEAFPSDAFYFLVEVGDKVIGWN